MENEFRPLFEHSIYVPAAKFDTDIVRRVAAGCGGCTVIYAAGGSWVSPEGELVTEQVHILRAITCGYQTPASMQAIQQHLLAHGLFRYGIDETASDGQRHIGFQQRDAHFAHRCAHVPGLGSLV